MLLDAILSALVNVVLLAGIPYALYALHHRRRGRTSSEIRARAGLTLGDRRSVGISVFFAAVVTIVLIAWPPPVEPFTRKGSAQADLIGLGFGAMSVTLALIYGVIKTGFPEELLFRGLIAGSLARRLPFVWANGLQALIFLLPHLVLLAIMPEMWGLLPLQFAGALILGWVRHRSGSIVGPWIVHATLNVVMGLSVAIRS